MDDDLVTIRLARKLAVRLNEIVGADLENIAAPREGQAGPDDAARAGVAYVSLNKEINSDLTGLPSAIHELERFLGGA